MSNCDCEPTTHTDGSLSHDPDCAAYPWCPHETGAYSCLIPCGCECVPCRRLSPPVVFEAPTRRSSFRGRAIPRRATPTPSPALAVRAGTDDEEQQA